MSFIRPFPLHGQGCGNSFANTRGVPTYYLAISSRKLHENESRWNVFTKNPQCILLLPPPSGVNSDTHMRLVDPRGHQGRRGSTFFHFHAVFCTKMFGSWHPLGKILDPPLHTHILYTYTHAHTHAHGIVHMARDQACVTARMLCFQGSGSITPSGQQSPNTGRQRMALGTLS